MKEEKEWVPRQVVSLVQAHGAHTGFFTKAAQMPAG